MSELPQDTKNAIVHLCQLLERDGLNYSSLDIMPAGIALFSLGEYDQTINYKVHNPIQAIADNVLQEICTDCLKLEYFFADPYFCSLVKSYLEVLISKYGSLVPITKTIAQVSLKHSLTVHHIAYRAKDGELYVITQEDHSAFKDNTVAWFLKVK